MIYVRMCLDKIDTWTDRRFFRRAYLRGGGGDVARELAKLSWIFLSALK